MTEILSEEQFDILHVCHPMRVGEIVKSAHTKRIPIVPGTDGFLARLSPGNCTSHKRGFFVRGLMTGEIVSKRGVYSGDFLEKQDCGEISTDN
ncbi:MAG: hypothetical protein MZV63_12260 [Marinilabiliales bacterium]|nr:hypothetical protein [Marinilabiliales bacterium]